MDVKRIGVCMGVAGVLAMGGASHAATMVDNFDYPAQGDGLAGKGTATGGWAGAWATVASGPLSTEGDHVGAGPGGINRGNTRAFSTPLTITSGSPTIWLSFAMLVDFDGTNGNSQTVVGLVGAGSYGRVNVNTPAGNLKWSAYVHPSNPNYEFSSVDVPDNVWSDVAVRLVPTGNGVASYTMWVDPDYTLDHDDPNQVAPILSGTMNLGNTTIASVELYRSVSTSNNIDRYDSLRISDESSPFLVPEPAGLALLGGGVLGLLARRRHVS